MRYFLIAGATLQQRQLQRADISSLKPLILS
jgi:hypothetical protein